MSKGLLKLGCLSCLDATGLVLTAITEVCWLRFFSVLSLVSCNFFFYTFFFSPSEALTSIAWSVAILRILDAELFMNAKALWH